MRVAGSQHPVGHREARRQIERGQQVCLRLLETAIEEVSFANSVQVGCHATPRAEPQIVLEMLEREIASFQDQLAGSASTDETRRQISDYLTELPFHFRTLSARAERLEAETRTLLGTETAASSA